LGGSVLSMLAIVLLIAVSSIQAFLMISQQSATNNQVGFSPVPQLGDVGLVGDAAVALAAGGLGLVTGGAAGALLGGDAAATGGSTTQRQTTDAAAAPTAPVTADEVVSVYGIRVHTSIAEDLRDLIDHAAADGIVLSGWGWRDNATQIRLRREHCGTSDYAIYQMPSSQCRPPTARPGRSQHELGLAVDFTYNGGSISTRRNPGFQWLQANAATYGLKNLASEPWHWSTTGR
ncbi:MAG: M15 family metallopeptidase, partial [Actinomycetota bacterium]